MNFRPFSFQKKNQKLKPGNSADDLFGTVEIRGPFPSSDYLDFWWTSWEIWNAHVSRPAIYFKINGH